MQLARQGKNPAAGRATPALFVNNLAERSIPKQARLRHEKSRSGGRVGTPVGRFSAPGVPNAISHGGSSGGRGDSVCWRYKNTTYPRLSHAHKQAAAIFVPHLHVCLLHNRRLRTSNCQCADCRSCLAWSRAHPAASTNWLIITCSFKVSIFGPNSLLSSPTSCRVCFQQLGPPPTPLRAIQ